MSRGGWDEAREDEGERNDPYRPAEDRGPDLTQDRRNVPPPRDPRHATRDRDGREYQVRDSEWQLLDTIGRFRVVSERDLTEPGRESTTRNDLRHLAEARLIDRKTAIVNHQPERLVVLTPAGKDLAERRSRTAGRAQRYYAGFVKPRELAHDAQIYRAYRAEESRLAAEGKRITRVVLDYELKRDYQTFLNRAERPADRTIDADRHAFADERSLPIIDGHLELPDLRLEIERPDGTVETRDIEVVTEHYSRSQLSGKARAGFTLYRPARVSIGGRSGSTRGGTPLDPHTLEWLR